MKIIWFVLMKQLRRTSGKYPNSFKRPTEHRNIKAFGTRSLISNTRIIRREILQTRLYHSSHLCRSITISLTLVTLYLDITLVLGLHH